MRNWAKQLFRVENIPLVVAIAVSIGFFVYDFFVPTADVVSNVIVGVLDALALGLLAERLGYFSRIEKVLGTLQSDKGMCFQVPEGWQSFEAYCRAANDVVICGGSLAQVARRYSRQLFEDMAQRGCTLRFVLLNPESPALSHVAQWARNIEVDAFKRHINESLSDLRRLMDTSENVYVKLNNSIPALTVMGFNVKEPDGIIRIDLNLYRVAPDRRLYFELMRDPYDSEKESWYQSFLEQLEDLWEEAEEWPG